ARAASVCLRCAERQGHGSATGIFRIVDGDRSAEFFGGMLDLAEIIEKGAVEVDTGITDADHRIVVVPDGFDVDAFVLGAVDRAVAEIPEYEGQEIFVGAEFEVPVDLVDYYRL